MVGATWPKEAVHLRKLMPNTPFLIPGYGAQGGSSKDAMISMDKNGFGGIVNNSRGVIFAYRQKEFADYAKKNWQKAVELASEKMRDDLNSITNK